MERQQRSIRSYARKKTLLLSLFLFSAYSLKIDNAEFGYRLEKVNIALSQKFPPAMAFELLEDSSSVVSQSEPKTSIGVTSLTVGYFELEPIRLDEISFQSNSLRPSESSFGSLTPNSVDELDQSTHGFTEEEQLRVRMARQRNGLEFKDLVPRQEASLSEKIQTLLKKEQESIPAEAGNKNQESESAYVHPRSRDTNSVSLINTPKNRQEPPLAKGYHIQGDIEFVRDGRLILTDKHFIDVRRYEEGIPKEVAQVDLVRGTFALDVAGTKGVVIGRLTNHLGKVEGEGIVSVMDFLSSKTQRLVLAKKETGGRFQSRSAYGKGRYDEVTKIELLSFVGGRPEAISSIDVNALDVSSDLVVETMTDGHRPTTALVNSRYGANLVMLPEKMIRGLTEVFLEQNVVLDLDRGDSLIWGEVRDVHGPAEGASVITSQGRASYLGNLYLPDQLRTTTSDNGMFVVPIHHPGWVDFYVELRDGRGIHINAIAFPGKVTQVYVEPAKENVPVTLRTFDAFTGEPIRAQLDFQHGWEVIDTEAEGTALVDLPKTKSLLFLTVRPQAPYENIRIGYSHFMDYIHVPLFSKAWLEELRGANRINALSQTGTLVGFVQGDEFTVEFPNTATQAKVIYFDQQGRASSRGVAGGGFVAFNVEEDQIQLLISSERTKKEIIRVIRPANDYVQVLNVNFE